MVPPAARSRTYFAVGTVLAMAAVVIGSFATSLLFIPYNSSAVSYNSTVLSDRPVGLWNMDNTLQEPDLTGNGATGTYKGGIPAFAALPNGEQAAVFNGSTQYLTIPSSPKFSIPTTGQLAWEVWIKPSTLQFPKSSTGYGDIMGKCEQYAPTCEWETRMYTTTNSSNRCNRLSAYVFNPSAGLGSGADWQPTCGLFQVDRWLHVVGQYDLSATPARCSAAYPGSINIWVNGIKWNDTVHGTTGCMSQYAIRPTATGSALTIGTMAKDFWFAGSIGKVAIYDHLLGQERINAHFSAMTGAQPSGSCADSCTTQLVAATTPTPAPTPTPKPTAPAPVTSTSTTAPTPTPTSSQPIATPTPTQTTTLPATASRGTTGTATTPPVSTVVIGAPTPAPADVSGTIKINTPNTMKSQSQPVSLRVDGVPVSLNGTLDTKLLSNGNHSVTVTRSDGTAASQTITVQNKLNPLQAARNVLFRPLSGSYLLMNGAMVLIITSILALPLWLGLRIVHHYLLSRAVRKYMSAHKA